MHLDFLFHFLRQIECRIDSNAGKGGSVYWILPPTFLHQPPHCITAVLRLSKSLTSNNSLEHFLIGQMGKWNYQKVSICSERDSKGNTISAAELAGQMASEYSSGLPAPNSNISHNNTPKLKTSDLLENALFFSTSGAHLLGN